MTRHDALSSPVSGYDGLILTLVYDQSQIYILQIIHKVLSHDIIQQILLNIFSLKKTVKRTDAFISRPSGASPHYARQADPPVGDLLSDCVNAMPQENIFTRQSKRYATIGGRNDRKVSFQTIKGRNGQYGRSVDNISKMTEQIANQRFFSQCFACCPKIYASCKNCPLCPLLI